jgi:hypothetical protein
VRCIRQSPLLRWGARSPAQWVPVARDGRHYRNKLIARMDVQFARCKKGGKRRRKLMRAKKKRLSKLTHQIHEIEHKQTSESLQHAAPGGRREAGHGRCAHDPARSGYRLQNQSETPSVVVWQHSTPSSFCAGVAFSLLQWLFPLSFSRVFTMLLESSEHLFGPAFGTPAPVEPCGTRGNDGHEVAQEARLERCQQ